MNNSGTLYRYEVKKILSRKLVWIVFLVCVFCIMLFSLADLSGKYYVDGEVVDTHYHMFKSTRDTGRRCQGGRLTSSCSGRWRRHTERYLPGRSVIR